MINKNETLLFNSRIAQYNSYTTEKEIETEFYNFLKKYYENKYTIISEGKINYTAPYNIDGLLEIRTLETDYRILVEAKASKNYGDKKVRNEVLSQAIYYCRKLKSYGEQLPSLILLLEAKSMAIINSESIKDFINMASNYSAASGAYKTDFELIEKLNSTEYHYKIITFNGETDYNSVFVNKYID